MELIKPSSAKWDGPVFPESTFWNFSSLHQHYDQVMPPNNYPFMSIPIYFHLLRSVVATERQALE